MDFSKGILKTLAAVSVVSALAAPYFASAAAFSYSAWLPFWKQQSGAQEMSLNLYKFGSVSPFSYEVKSGGRLVDMVGLDQGFWPAWLSAARDANVKIIPTLAWFDGQAIHAMLSNKTKRIAHENAIVKLVKDKKYDGIDIDYESKLAATKDYFSTFLYGLAIRLHPLGKTLSCTIESRTPLTSLYAVIPPDIKYANDYAALNKYCDEVRIMAYDQGLIDLKLDAEKASSALYAPVADHDWVTKVLNEALKTISRKKIVLGIPTYGYEYQLTWANGRTKYERLRSHTFFTAMDRAESYGLIPGRNSAGELSFDYTTGTLVADVSDSLIWYISSTLPAAIASSAAQGGYTRFVSFSDAQSAAQKIQIAKKLGLKGAAFFKMDGEADPAIWADLK